MQWAVRNTPSQRATGSAPSSSSTPAGQWSFVCLWSILIKCLCLSFQMIVTKTVCINCTCYDLFLFHSKLHRPDIYWPYQPASLQCYQFQCCCCCGCSGGQQLQQLSDICQQPGAGLQHCHQADLRPHESDSQIQPSGLLTVPCCCKAHLPGCSQPAGKIHYHHVAIKIYTSTPPTYWFLDPF